MSENANEDIGDLEEVKLIYKDNDEENQSRVNTIVRRERENMKNVHGYRVINVVSLSVIFLGYFAVWVYSFIAGNLNMFYEFYKTKSHHFQMDFIFFHICWVFILTSCVITICRMSWIDKADNEMEKEIYHILQDQYHHLYYLANIFFSLYMTLSIFRLPEKYGVDSIIGFTSLLLYFLVYKNYNSSIHTKSFYNFLAFEMHVSFLFCWNLCLNIISIFSFIESHEHLFPPDSIESIAFVFHLLISCINIIFIAYYIDVFFNFIVLVYQIGIVYRNKTLNNNEDRTTLVFCIFSFICFIYTIFISKKKDVKHKDLDAEEVNRVYNKFKRQASEVSSDAGSKLDK